MLEFLRRLGLFFFLWEVMVMVWFWIGFVGIVLIVMAVWSNVYGHILYSKDGHDDLLDVKIKALFGAFRYHYSVPIIKFKGLKQGISIEKDKSTNIPIQP